jgi:hypothetical protein
MPERAARIRGDRDARRLASEAPWLRDDLGPLLASTVVGLVGLVAGYLGASSTVEPSRQLAWMTAAVVMVIVAGAGNALWLGVGRRSVRARRDRLVARLRDDPATVAVRLRSLPRPGPHAAADRPATVVPGAALVPEEFLSYLAAEESE